MFLTVVRTRFEFFIPKVDSEQESEPIVKDSDDDFVIPGRSIEKDVMIIGMNKKFFGQVYAANNDLLITFRSCYGDKTVGCWIASDALKVLQIYPFSIRQSSI